jgi:hypothetical protein
VGQADAVEELAGPIAVPDLDTDLVEGEGGCVALDEPEELGDDGAEEDPFCCEQREDGAAVVVELELEALGCENRQGAGAGAGGGGDKASVHESRMSCMSPISEALPIGSSLTLVQDLADQVEVLVLLVYGRRPHCLFPGPKTGTRPRKKKGCIKER